MHRKAAMTILQERTAPSRADRAWLRMDAPSNPMVITAVMLFEEPLRYADLERHVVERLLPQTRFRQRLSSENPRTARWQIDPDFDLRGHLHHVALPSPADQGELERVIGELMSSPLDPRRPLWQFHLLDGYEGGGSALVFRIHHAVADGFALVGLLRSTTDAPDDAAAHPHPSPVARAAFGPVATAGHTAAALGRLLLLPDDPRTPLKGELGPTKCAAFTRPFSVPVLKAIAHRHGAKLNDVFAALVAGALHRYLAAHGPVPPGLEIRAVVPVNLRPEDAPASLGNRFGLVFLDLPLGRRSPEQRLGEIAARTQKLKRGSEAPATFAALEGMGFATKRVDDLVIALFQAKATVVLTSLPGPSARVTLAGQEAQSLAFWAPQAGGLGLGLSFLSYAGEARVGVASDAKVVAHPDEIVRALEAEYELVACTA
jgi:diacylglycerol O-acyltransferase / wax synthase